MTKNLSDQCLLYSTKLSTIDFTNHFVALLIGLPVIGSIFYSIFFTQLSSSFKVYSKMILLSTTVDLLYLLSNFLCLNELKFAGDKLIVKSDAIIATSDFQVLFLSWIFSLKINASTSLLPQHLFRYFIVCRYENFPTFKFSFFK
jgi:hypothetical protein